jgi:hypothetical protein
VTHTINNVHERLKVLQTCVISPQEIPGPALQISEQFSLLICVAGESNVKEQVVFLKENKQLSVS